MLFVNNSPRCRLRSLCPSFPANQRRLPTALWLEEMSRRRHPLCKSYCCMFSLVCRLFKLSSPFCLLCRSQSVGWESRYERSVFLLNRICCFTAIFIPCHLPSLLHLLLSISFPSSISWSFRVKEKWKTPSPSTRQLVEKEINPGLKFWGQTSRKSTSERRIEDQVEGQN